MEAGRSVRQPRKPTDATPDYSEGDDCHWDELPVEMLETLLMRTFMMTFAGHMKTRGHVSQAEYLAYRMLTSVCGDWWQTLHGWSHSDTNLWVKHQLQRRVKYVCRPYRRHPQLVTELSTKKDVRGVARLDDKIFVVSRLSNTIEVFGLNYEQLEDIEVGQLKAPTDMAACSATKSLYVTDWGSRGCVWWVSTDGQFFKFRSIARPWTLSVTSGRLLVTTDDDELLLYGADGARLTHLSFPGLSIQHAVETSRGTFILCHLEPQRQVVEVDVDGQFISVFNHQQQLTSSWYLSTDSEDKIFIVDNNKQHILLLSNDLRLDRVLLDIEHNQLVKEPWRLLYVEQTRQLIVASGASRGIRGVVQVFTVR